MRLSIAGSLFAFALLGTSSCGRIEPAEKIAPRITIEAPTSRSLPAGPQSLDDSGVTAWADEFQGSLIAGLDGGFYIPYRSATIERVQRALRERGLYTGPTNGVLDLPTMESIYEFQQANASLQRCGIPTPRTRNMLEQGSHTDLTS